MADDDVEISGGIRDKLIEKKQEWAREGRLLTGTTADPSRQRLPPGQRLVTDWPVLDLGAEPNVTPEKFRLDIDGAVEHRLSLRLDEFMALPQTETVSDIHCVTQWSRYDNHWKGVAARDITGGGAAEPRSQPRRFHVVRRIYDQYKIGAVRSARRIRGARMGGQATEPRPWRAGANAGARGCIYGNREMAAAHSVHHQRSSRVLGAARLP